MAVRAYCMHGGAAVSRPHLPWHATLLTHARPTCTQTYPSVPGLFHTYVYNGRCSEQDFKFSCAGSSAQFQYMRERSWAKAPRACAHASCLFCLQSQSMQNAHAAGLLLATACFLAPRCRHILS